MLTNRLKNYELDIIKQFDLLLPISSIEEKYFKDNSLNKCIYLPFGIENIEIEISENKFQENSCYHIGSMEWAPNIEGVQWFLNDVWESAKDKLPNVVFYLAGRNMPASLLKKENSQLDVVGEVEDFVTFSLEKNIMIVPLLSGAGIRVKIIEAMNLGKTIITTSVGAEGIDATHQKNIFICDTPQSFIETLVFCFENKEKSLQVGSAAKEFAQSNFCKQKIYQKIIEDLKYFLETENV